MAANLAIRNKSEELTKAQKKQWKATYLSQFEDIIAAEAELQHNWGSREARDKLSDAQAVLHEVRQQKFQYQESAILSKWARVGDRCTKEFFEHHSGHKKPTPITQLMDGERSLTQQTELENHILSFYKNLYTSDELVENNEEAREDCFSFVKQTVTDAHNAELLQPLTLKEVTTAMNQIPAGKAPGVDSIPSEFYHELWDDIGPDVFNFVCETVSQTCITEELNVSKIALLLKSEDRIRIQNYRPISLLNTLYKVVAKVYANRMKPLLHHWILPSQTGFVPNRCILDNIFLAFESIEWALENNQQLSMLLLDFEKAYDRVSWKFLSQAMARMGFNERWIQQVMSLNTKASATIIINGEQSQPFKLQRSVRQGCPLAPYLFLLTVDVLGQMLQHPDCRVQGLRLPDNTSITNQMFADDTLLLLDGNPENMDRAINVINRFGAASGAKLNLHKSIGLWISHTARTWQWGEAAGLKWLQPGEVTRYLGYPFGLHIPQKEKDSKMLGQIRKHLHKWAGNKLSLAGRIMVSNQVILSSIWYLASCTDLSGQALKLARTTVRNYIWSGKEVSCARARVKWATAVLPIVRGGVKILDPQWQASALLVKLLIRGMTAGYEPWKVLVRYRVAQTQQSRRGRWPSNSNWIMNSSNLVKKGSSMWQGVMKAWRTIQSGLEQQDPTTWSEIMRQPIYGNRFLTSEDGIQWGTAPRSNMLWWAAKGYNMLKDLARHDGYGWRTFPELHRLHRTNVAPQLHAKVLNSIPWDATPMPSVTIGQWVAAREENGDIQKVYRITQIDPPEATLYQKDSTERLTYINNNVRLVADTREVRVVRTFGPRNTIIDYNPSEDLKEEQQLWLWGNNWVSHLEWDPKEWTWRRLGMIPDTTILNYTTKRGYRVALRHDNHQMPLDAELEASGMYSKTRAKFFNRIWHPHLPRKVSAMQWLILTEGLPVGAWRERIGLSSACQICPTQDRETLQHAFMDCSEVKQAWFLFRNTRRLAGLTSGYSDWKEISRGRLTDPPGPSVEEDLRWDTAAAYTINSETPWDILRAQLLWAIWCQKVVHAFSEDQFHLGAVLWNAWRNTVYCAMEAYKELFRHKRNEQKRQEMIACFEKIWTEYNIFGRASDSGIKWNTTPHQTFLPRELGAWITPPIRIHRNSPSPDPPEADFAAQPDFEARVHDFVQNIADNLPPPTPPVGSPLTQSERSDPAAEASDWDVPDSVQASSRAAPDSHSTQQPPYDGDPQVACNHPLLAIDWHTEPTQPLRDQHTAFNDVPHRVARAPLRALNPNVETNDRVHNRLSPAPPLCSDEPRSKIRPSSRPKIKCGFGPLKRNASASTTRSTSSPPTFAAPSQHGDATFGAGQVPVDGLATELDALLKDIDLTRNSGEALNANSKPTSRAKRRCYFGPRSKKLEDLRVSGPESPEVLSLPIPSPEHHDDCDVSEPPFPGHHDQDPVQPSVNVEASTSHQPCDRVTFTHPSDLPLRHSPFQSYFSSVTNLPRPNPNRFALRRMGLTEAQLQVNADRDAVELLREVSTEQRLARIFSSEPTDPPRILTREDCMQFFFDTGVPTSSGALLGAYRWAAGLGEARFNFELPPDTTDFSFMDAYD